MDDAPFDLHDPAGCAARVFAALERGVSERGHAYHLMSVSTIAADGSPTLRTVVLRGVEADRRVLRFHADVRGPKMAELAADPRVGILLYDPASRWQVRVVARATVHTGDDVARAGWHASQPMSRACYAATVGPSAVLPTVEPLVAPIPPAEDDAAAFAHFAVVACHFDELELLALLASGHVRFRLRWAADAVTLTPLAP